MANPKPLVAVACFCENVLQEEGHVFSAVRIVDTYTLHVPAGVPEELPEGASFGPVQIKGLIALKSGEFTGESTIRIVMNRLNGEKVDLSPAGGWPVVFKGGENGINVRLEFPLGVRTFGLLWFDVLWNDEVLTRIPLRLKRVTPESTS